MSTQRVNLSIPTKKLTELIQSGVLCAADFHCLDQESKQKVWQMCLWCCSKKINCTKDCSLNCTVDCQSTTPFKSSTSIEQVEEITSQSKTKIPLSFMRLL